MELSFNEELGSWGVDVRECESVGSTWVMGYLRRGDYYLNAYGAYEAAAENLSWDC